VSYDPLLHRVQTARDLLKSAIRKSKASQDKAKTELDLLYVLEADLNLNAIMDRVPAPLSADDAETALWNAIQNIEIGNKTDDKLILVELEKLGFGLVRLGDNT
jgi:hypothetical protein